MSKHKIKLQEQQRISKNELCCSPCEVTRQLESFIALGLDRMISI